jgi:hypothetical protein
LGDEQEVARKDLYTALGLEPQRYGGLTENEQRLAREGLLPPGQVESAEQRPSRGSDSGKGSRRSLSDDREAAALIPKTFEEISDETDEMMAEMDQPNGEDVDIYSDEEGELDGDGNILM